METLEEALQNVRGLSEGLAAVHVVQSEKWDWEEEEVPERQGGIGADYDRGGLSQVKVRDRIEEPDEGKRAEAHDALQALYDSSPWYSVRYAAGVALGADVSLTERLPSWIEQLCSQLGAMKTERQSRAEPIYEREELPPRRHSDDNRWGPEYEERFVGYETVWHSVSVPDLGVREKAICDAAALFGQTGSDDLQKVLVYQYTDGVSSSLRVPAGKALGHCGARIWAHELWKEHPGKVLLGGVVVTLAATTAALAGAIYGVGKLLDYLNK